jgi:hypothetical protein
VRKFRKRQHQLFVQLTSNCFDSNNDLRGKSAGSPPVVAFPGGQPVVGQRSVFATWKQLPVVNPICLQFDHCLGPWVQGESSWPEEL